MMRLELSKHHWPLSHKIKRLAWLFTWHVFGYWGPGFLSPCRVLLLRLFGAKIGRAPLICGHVKILMPWNLKIDDFVAISEGVNIYNFGYVSIGNNSCISQGVWLCTGSHDYTRPDFPLIWDAIHIGSSVWVASEAFIHPGVHIGDGAVVGARSVVTKNMPAGMVCAGNPCKPLKYRAKTDILPLEK